jgi:GNAT domain-containint protein
MTRAAPFLDPDVIARGCVEAGLGPAALATLSTLARRIAADELLAAACVDAHRAVYHEQGDFADAVERSAALLGPDVELLNALYLLDSLRLVHERQAARGVDVAVSRAINERHAVAWLRAARDPRGVPRVRDWLPSWFRLVGSGELYRLGRLELAPERWQYPFRAYVHEQSGDAVMLAESGLGFTPSGELLAPESEASFRSELTETDDAVIGTPVSPRGHALARRVRLPAADWSLALTRDDWMLDIHVPAEGELAIGALRDALERALAFFAQHYPARPFTAFVCDSWLFSTQLERLLGEPSNILAWQREGYLLPGDGGHDSFLKFVFGSPAVDPETAPRDTRLRRALLDELARGARLHDGVFVLLVRDLPRFGKAPYRHASERAISELMDGA